MQYVAVRDATHARKANKDAVHAMCKKKDVRRDWAARVQKRSTRTYITEQCRGLMSSIRGAAYTCMKPYVSSHPGTTQRLHYVLADTETRGQHARTAYVPPPPPYVRCDLLPPIKHVQARAARES